MSTEFSLWSRRDWLARTGLGIGALGLSAAISEGRTRADEKSASRVHFPSPAKHLIVLFMSGGPSSLDTFDHKPLLRTHAGKPLPDSLVTTDRVRRVLQNSTAVLAPDPFRWRPHGESGLWVSELFSETARHADRMCVVRTVQSASANHAPAVYQMTTGSVRGEVPSLGSWTAYGLGRATDNLPAFVSLFDVLPSGGPAVSSARFLPSWTTGVTPAQGNRASAPISRAERDARSLVERLNRMHADQKRDARLDARIAAFERTFREQAASLDALDVHDETAETQRLYGLDQKETRGFALQCLRARRLVERGVRVVQLFHGEDRLGWDGHRDLEENHRRNAGSADRPIAGLLDDLARRGLLDETLVLWCGEFGRLPVSQGDGGRNHNPFAFTVWMAGGPVRGGRTVGLTDPFGLLPVTPPCSVADLHATLLAGLGVDADRFVYPHHGREHRLTGVAGAAEVIAGVYD